MAAKYTLFPTAGAGIWNCCLAPLAAGVPAAPIRAQELAGLVTPGKALNEACCVLAPWELKIPVKVMSPEMVVPLCAAAELAAAAGLDVVPLDVVPLDVVPLDEAEAAGLLLAEAAAE